jgi:tetratricopeptide (TPR) repeat protein
MVKALPEAMVGQYAVGRVAAESGQRLDRGAAALARYLAYQPKPGEPSLASAHWRLGAVREAQGQREAARAEYEAALRLDPKLRGAARHSTGCADPEARRRAGPAVTSSSSSWVGGGASIRDERWPPCRVKLPDPGVAVPREPEGSPLAASEMWQSRVSVVTR